MKDIFRELEERLSDALAAKTLAKWEGDAIGLGYCDIYYSGRSGEAMWALLEQLVREVEPLKGSYAKVGTRREAGGDGIIRRIDL